MRVKKLSPKEAALATLAYADVFDYPLTRQEFSEWSLFFSRISLGRTMNKKRGFIFLKGREKLVDIRELRQTWQDEKWEIAKHTAKWLSVFPTVQLVGVTGGLAMNNAKKEDDIDLFLVTAAGTIWITRFMVTIWLNILGLRRKPNEVNVTNKVCLNMFVAPRGLAVPVGEHDCFAAHEVLQMKPLWAQKGSYRKFLFANEWSKTYLPRAWGMRLTESVFEVSQTPVLVVWAFRIFDFPAKLIQIFYMQHNITHEVVTDSVLRFHPFDARVWVKRKFAARLKVLKVPLDKVFYAR